MHAKLPRVAVVGIVAFSLLSNGCRSIGPRTIPRDRFDYSDAIESWKHATLLNIIKLRYLDLPIFLDVAQVVSGYQLETAVNMGGKVGSASALGGADAFSMGAAGKYVDRPTITYMPLTGNDFLEGFLTPVEPSRVFFMLQSGYAADFVLEMSLDSFNGLQNQSATYGSSRTADPDFLRVTRLIRKIQDVGALGMQVKKEEEGQKTTLVFFRDEQASEETRAQIRELKDLLGIVEEQQRFKLVYSPIRGEPGELAVTTRSILRVLGALATGVEPPKAHVERGLLPPVPGRAEQEHDLFRVHSGEEKPDDVYVAVRYQDAWFWIEHEDWHTKRTFAFVMFLFTLSDTGDQERLPLVTIPAQ
jgi:hypothetical protein